MGNQIGPKPPTGVFSLASRGIGQRARLLLFLRRSKIKFNEENAARLDRSIGTFAGAKIEVHLSKEQISRYIFGDEETPLKEIFYKVTAKAPMSPKELGLAKKIIRRFGGNLDKLPELTEFLFGCVDFSNGLAINFYFDYENVKHMEVSAADWLYSAFMDLMYSRSKNKILMQGGTYIIYSSHHNQDQVVSLIYNCREERKLIRIEIQFPSKGRKLVVRGSFDNLPQSDGFYSEKGQQTSGTRIDALTRESILNYTPPFSYDVKVDLDNPFLLPFDRIRGQATNASSGFESAYPKVGEKVIDLSAVRMVPPPGFLEAFNDHTSSGREFVQIATQMLARRLLEAIGSRTT